MAWFEFAAAFGVFFLSHSVPVRPPVRRRLVGCLGERGFLIAYSGLSLAVLVWLIGAAGRAPHVPLWFWAPWQTQVPLVIMLPVCLIIAFAAGRANPFSFGGTNDATFDPAHPGLVRWMRHPFLVALALWAAAHLVANGDLAHVLLFGCFAGFALIGQRIVDRRKRRALGAKWDTLNANLRASPLLPRPRRTGPTVLRAGAGVALYVGLIEAHPLLFGVDPLP